MTTAIPTSTPLDTLIAAAREARTYLRSLERQADREIEQLQDKDDDLTPTEDRQVERLEARRGDIEEVAGLVADLIRETRRARL